MKFKLFDLHQDISHYLNKHGVNDFDQDDPKRQVDIPKMRRANLKFVVAAIFPFTTSINPLTSDILRRGYGLNKFGGREPSLTNFWLGYKTYLILERKYSHVFKIIRNKDDLQKLINDDKIGLILGIEGCDVLSDVLDIYVLHEMNIKVIGLTWNFTNKFASSCMSRKDFGLSDLGEELVRYANELGLVIDLAHASKQTMIDVLKISKKPVIISHANVFKVKQHVRNVDDEVLELLVKNRGVIGLTLIKSTIGVENTIDELIQHFKYLRECYTVDIIGIGTDYLGINEAPKGLERIDYIVNLREKLLNAGFTESEVQKIFFENSLRVFLENLT